MWEVGGGGALLIRWTVPKRTCDSGDNYCDSADPAKSDSLHGKARLLLVCFVQVEA